MTTKSCSVCTIAAIALAVWAMPDLSPAAERPNIIYILADDLGYGDLGCYGQQRIKTPAIDRMAAEGMKFTQHYAGSTVCAPSRCSLLTGLHQGHARIRGNGRALLKDEDVTVAEILKRAGYATGCIGKWGVGHPPPPGDVNRNGFDYFFGYLSMYNAHNYYPPFLHRNGKQVPLDNVPKKKGKGGRYGHRAAGVAVEKKEYSHDLFAEDALAFIERNKDKPFFLYLTFTIPHANNEAGRRGMEVPDYGIYKHEDWPDQQKGHAAMITRMDRDVGRLLAKLKALGLDEKTLVIFTSDNGPHKEGGADPDFFDSNSPLRGIKRALYEGGIRVPMIARWPGRVPAGSRSDHVSAFWDMMPTFAELAGAQMPERTDGISMVPALLGKADRQQRHEFLYWEFWEQGGKQAVRAGDWKAVRVGVHRNPDGPIELYNLKTDPGEETDVADKHPDIVAEMAQRMKAEHVDLP